MTGLDFNNYKNEYGGRLTEEEFTRFYPEAANVIYAIAGENPGGGTYARAVYMEVDYLAACVGEMLPDGRTISQERLGDYAISYSEGEVTRVGGIPVSPKAILALRCAGLLSLWI